MAVAVDQHSGVNDAPNRDLHPVQARCEPIRASCA
jgi:hypothetical protein